MSPNLQKEDQTEDTMPTAARAAKLKAKLKALDVRVQKQESISLNLSATKAAVLVDKNSRTIVKLTQLIAIYNKPGASELDSGGLVAHRIERYKQRVTRRLNKLAKVQCLP